MYAQVRNRARREYLGSSVHLAGPWVNYSLLCLYESEREITRVPQQVLPAVQREQKKTLRCLYCVPQRRACRVHDVHYDIGNCSADLCAFRLSSGMVGQRFLRRLDSIHAVRDEITPTPVAHPLCFYTVSLICRSFSVSVSVSVFVFVLLANSLLSILGFMVPCLFRSVLPACRHGYGYGYGYVPVLA